jgi:ABC-type phosphate/phosphonate transport system ATPase subunit
VIKFKKVSPKEVGSPAPDTVTLEQNDWDDYGRKTTFIARYWNDANELHYLGRVKITRRGHVEGYVRIDDDFTVLRVEFASLGQTQSYYENLRQLPEGKGEAILKALKDVTIDPIQFESFRNDRSFESSLMREVSYSQIEKFRDVVRGMNTRLSYGVIYRPEGWDDEKFLDFFVQPGSKPHSNLHALIGRNGVGKTTLLANMAHAACANANALFQHPEYGMFISAGSKWSHRSPFGNVISVSFSAFDKFAVPRQDGTEELGARYEYVGLRVLNEDRLKMRKEIAADFSDALENCLFSARRELWLNAVKTLCSDPIFEKLDFQSVAYLDAASVRDVASTRFEDMSSGHQIVLWTITKLVELVEDRTLVLFDEPECHLHPPLLSSLMQALSDLLVERNALAIIATHSPVVLQEISGNCAWLVDRPANKLSCERLLPETFAENVGFLTQEVFGLELKRSGHYAIIQQVVSETGVNTLDDVIQRFGGHIGGEGKAIALALLASKNK